MKRKTKIIIISISITIIFAIASYILIGKAVLKNRMNEYLKDKGYSSNEIAQVKVSSSFSSYILGYGYWGISVEFVDEPDILYFYKYKSKEIVTNGVGGNSKVEKEDLKHRVHPADEKRYTEIYDSLEKAIKWEIDTTFVIRDEYNCTRYDGIGILSSEYLISQGYLKQEEMLDIDGKSYCKATINTHTSEYDGKTCDMEYEIGFKCQDYETPEYLEHPDLLFPETP